MKATVAEISCEKSANERRQRQEVQKRRKSGVVLERAKIETFSIDTVVRERLLPWLSSEYCHEPDCTNCIVKEDILTDQELLKRSTGPMLKCSFCTASYHKTSSCLGAFHGNFPLQPQGTGVQIPMKVASEHPIFCTNPAVIEWKKQKEEEREWNLRQQRLRESSEFGPFDGEARGGRRLAVRLVDEELTDEEESDGETEVSAKAEGGQQQVVGAGGGRSAGGKRGKTIRIEKVAIALKGWLENIPLHVLLAPGDKANMYQAILQQKGPGNSYPHSEPQSNSGSSNRGCTVGQLKAVVSARVITLLRGGYARPSSAPLPTLATSKGRGSGGRGRGGASKIKLLSADERSTAKRFADPQKFHIMVQGAALPLDDKMHVGQLLAMLQAKGQPGEQTQERIERGGQKQKHEHEEQPMGEGGEGNQRGFFPTVFAITSPALARSLRRDLEGNGMKQKNGATPGAKASNESTMYPSVVTILGFQFQPLHYDPQREKGQEQDLRHVLLRRLESKMVTDALTASQRTKKPKRFTSPPGKRSKPNPSVTHAVTHAVPSLGALLMRTTKKSKVAYINRRLDMISGMLEGAALGSMVPNSKGKVSAYKMADLKYDIGRGMLRRTSEKQLKREKEQKQQKQQVVQQKKRKREEEAQLQAQKQQAHQQPQPQQIQPPTLVAPANPPTKPVVLAMTPTGIPSKMHGLSEIAAVCPNAPSPPAQPATSSAILLVATLSTAARPQLQHTAARTELSKSLLIHQPVRDASQVRLAQQAEILKEEAKQSWNNERRPSLNPNRNSQCSLNPAATTSGICGGGPTQQTMQQQTMQQTMHYDGGAVVKDESITSSPPFTPPAPPRAPERKRRMSRVRSKPQRFHAESSGAHSNRLMKTLHRNGLHVSSDEDEDAMKAVPTPKGAAMKDGAEDTPAVDMVWVQAWVCPVCFADALRRRYPDLSAAAAKGCTPSAGDGMQVAEEGMKDLPAVLVNIADRDGSARAIVERAASSQKLQASASPPQRSLARAPCYEEVLQALEYVHVPANRSRTNVMRNEEQVLQHSPLPHRKLLTPFSLFCH
jgi:hypothetical protein